MTRTRYDLRLSDRRAAKLRRRAVPVPVVERSRERRYPDGHDGTVSRASGWFLLPPCR